MIIFTTTQNSAANNIETSGGLSQKLAVNGIVWKIFAVRGKYCGKFLKERKTEKKFSASLNQISLTVIGVLFYFLKQVRNDLVWRISKWTSDKLVLVREEV